MCLLIVQFDKGAIANLLANLLAMAPWCIIPAISTAASFNQALSRCMRCFVHAIFQATKKEAHTTLLRESVAPTQVTG